MSAGIITCPGCDTRLRVSVAPGTAVKCPKCGTHLQPAWPERSAIAAQPVPPPAPRPAAPPAARPAPPPAARPAAVRRAADDGEGGPRRGKKEAAQGGVPVGLILALVGGGVLFLAVLVGGVVALALYRGKSSSSSGGDDSSRAAVSADKPDKKDTAKQDSRQDPKKDPKQETKQETKGEEAKQPEVRPPADPPGDGSLPRDVLDRVKAATVYVRVQDAQGGRGSGSGFFEESTGKVLTNAHVVGMKEPGAPPPAKVEIVLNGGTPAEVVVAGRILTVDRTSDLCLLEAQLPPEKLNAVPKLKVNPAKELVETQRVYVFGFPFGEKVNRNVTVSSTSVSSLQLGPEGILKQVQVNGGMHPGNSGGPVVDARGAVVGVAVAGIPGTQINFAIPGESVRALLGGRLSGIVINTEAVARDGKYVVRVRFDTLDPSQRIRTIAVDYWVAPSEPKGLPPSPTRPQLPPGHVRRTAPATYDPQKQQATAELLLEELPPPGQMLWVQPFLAAGDNPPTWVAGTQYTIQPPVEPRASNLAYQPRPGQAPVDLKSTAKFKLEDGSGRTHSYLQNIESRLTETTSEAGPGGARVVLGVQRFAVGVSLDGEAPETSKRFQEAVRRDVGSLSVELRTDGKGNVVSRKNDVSRAPQPSREVLDSFGEQISMSFATVAVPLPGGTAQPGQTWQARRELPLDLPGSSQPAMVNMTYIYRGVRPHEGRQVGVLELRGTLAGTRDANSSLTGKTTGTALVEPETGTVLHVHAVSEATLNVRYRGDNFKAVGTLEVTLTRGAQGRPVVSDPPTGPNPPGPGRKIDTSEWVVQCMVSGRWTDFPMTKMTHTLKDGVLELTNNTGIYDWAGIVSKRRLRGDFTVRVEVRNARSVGLKAATDDLAWAAVEKLEGDDWKTVVITRKQGRVSATVDGAPVKFFDLNSGTLDESVFFFHVNSGKTAAIRRFDVE
jgi:S1-C subfamily serine protease